MLTADAILAIPYEEPERLFPDRTKIREHYRKLYAEWHASKDPRAGEVLGKLVLLQDIASDKHADGTWKAVAA